MPLKIKKRKIHPTLSEDIIDWMDASLDSLSVDGHYHNRHTNTHGKFIEVALQNLKEDKEAQKRHFGREI